MPYFNHNIAIVIVLAVFLVYFFIFEIVSVANKNIFVAIKDIWFWIDVTFLVIMILYFVYEFQFY